MSVPIHIFGGGALATPASLRAKRDTPRKTRDEPPPPAAPRREPSESYKGKRNVQKDL